MELSHKLISCDDHVDMDQLPADLWTSRLPKEFLDRAPHIEVVDGRSVWMCDGQYWGSWSGGVAPSTGPKAVFTAFDRGNAKQSELRAGTPKLRLEDMDRDGVYAHVIFGPVMAIKHSDTRLRDACYRAYNDWLAEFCSVAPDRLLGVPMLPLDPESAIEELKRLLAKGVFRQVNIQIAEVEPAIRDPRWEPMFQMLEDSNTVLAFHVTVFAAKVGAAYDAHGPGGTYWSAKAFPEQFLDPFVDLFAFGILERHPGLKIVMAESDAAWLPWLVEELDYRHGRMVEAEDFWAAKGMTLLAKPSDLFKRQIFPTFQQSPVAMRLTEFFGDNLLWASDYPHPDSIWPNSLKTISETMGHLSPEEIKKLTHDNAAKLYGLDTERPAARLAS